ncbi:hypothetical protein ACFLUO_01035 [Chloroflexota bacterium]
MNDFKNKMVVPKSNGEKDNFTSYSHRDKPRIQRERFPAQSPLATNYAGDELSRLTVVRAEIQKIRLNVQRELELAKQIRAKAERYQQETAELKRKTGEEIQKVLADIRMIRITAQEELETQRKYTSAARIKALSIAFQEGDTQGSEREKEAISV